MSEYLQRYLVAVEHPDVSGFEHLDMLLLRDKLAQSSSQLTPDQQAKLAAADQRLMSQVAAFYAALSQITDLAQRTAAAPATTGTLVVVPGRVSPAAPATKNFGNNAPIGHKPVCQSRHLCALKSQLSNPR
jgi:hypothetical protein